MKILYFGTYEKNYPRNRIIIDGLKQNNQEVKECHFPLWEEKDKTKRKINFFNITILSSKLIWAYFVLLINFLKIKFDYDVMMVGYPGHLDIFLAKFLSFFKKKPLIFNPLISIYDSVVLDRKLIQPSSLLAKLILICEKYIYRKSDFIILDTQAHINYFVKQFGLSKDKLKRIFVGAEDIFLYERNLKIKIKNNKKTKVLFIGKFTPLHGIEFILEAAKQLEKYHDLEFKIIGSGQLSSKIKKQAQKLKLKNINFKDWLSYKKLPQVIAEADICLGIFGTSDKAQRVIPNKVFQAIALKKVVITEKSPAISEAFKENENILICQAGDAHSLAQKIIEIKKNQQLRLNIGISAYKLFRKKFTTYKIGKETKKYLEEIIKNWKG